MDADNTDRLIVRAIAAIPYRRPSAGFSAKVMAEIAAVEVPLPWWESVLTASGLIVAVWAAALVFVSARLVYVNLADIAALFIQPGGFSQTLNLLAARTALVMVKAAAALKFASGLLSAAAAGLPAWHETAAAALLCSAAIAALSKSGRVSVQKTGI